MCGQGVDIVLLRGTEHLTSVTAQKCTHSCLKIEMSDHFLVAAVLSLEGNHIMRSTSLQRTSQTLDLPVSQLHLKEVK